MIFRGLDGAKHTFAFSPKPIPRASQYGWITTGAGMQASFEGAVGLPAFLNGLRLLSETAASLPFLLYRGYGKQRKEQPAAPQHKLLRRPNQDQDPFATWSYSFVSLLRGNAYFYKVKVRGKTVALYPVNPDFVTPKYEGSGATFDLRDRQYGPVVETVTKDKIIHIPGILLTDPYIGVSIIAAEANAIGAEMDRQTFEGSHLQSNGRPDVVLKHPGNPSKEIRDELRDGYTARHAGKPGGVGMAWGGWDIVPLPVSLQESQFIESKQYSVADIGRMLGIPSGLLNDPNAPAGDSPEHENMRFLQRGVGPWLTRMEKGLAADLDLFPEQDWTVEADERALLRADFKTRAEGHRLARQGGWETANEIREAEGLPPHPDGDELQQTPVGGAENPGQSSEPGKQADQEG